MEEKTYSIIRFFKEEGKEAELIREGLTLQEAKNQCNNEDTRGEDFFDGFREE
jgi:hypothetical protein